MSSSKLIPRAALVVLAMLVFAAPAAAKTQQLTVPGTLVVLNAQYSNGSNSCVATAFVQWANVPGTTSATVTANRTNGSTTSESAKGPAFHDVLTHGYTFIAPPGTHWINLGASWRLGGAAPLYCSDMAATIRAGYTGVASVRLTVDIPVAVCNAAKAVLLKQQKAVKKLAKKVKKAKGKKKRKLKKSLTAAKKKQTAANAAVSASC